MSTHDRFSSRRRPLVGGAVAAGVGATLAATVRPAGAAAPLARAGDRLLPASQRHLVSRFSYGLTPALAKQVRAAGGARAWFEQQLDPDGVPDPGTAATRDWWGVGLRADAATLWQRQIDEVEAGWEVMANYARWTMVRRIRSRRPVLEMMAEFWENHLNVPVDGDAQFLFRTDYGTTIRDLALTSYEQILQACIVHPAMLIYLDQAVSTARHPNENLARELLELHTVGRGNYDEDDVKASARILTGWRVDMWRTWAVSYQPKDHWTGPVQVMDFVDANALADGRDLIRRYLRHLARHPATAHRIARKLAVKFVRDDPPTSLVAHLAEVYLAHDTQIKPVLRALVRSPEFAGSRGAKLRDPGEDVAAAYRLLGVKVHRPTSSRSGANAILWQVGSLGTTPFAWPRPDGQPIDNESWSSPSRMVASMEVHLSLAGGWWPKDEVTYRRATAWAPRFPVRFDALVEHLARTILHQHSTPRLLEAACRAVSCSPTDRITRDHPVMQWESARLLSVFVDSPEFFQR